jgi:iron complex transport system ATP-binding protein
MPTPVLTLDNIHFFRGGESDASPPRTILSDVSWSVAPGQIAAILGANGCGKSTLLRIASGYLWPQGGTVHLLGRKLGETPLAPLRARLGILEANTVYPFDDTMTALEVVTSGYFSALTLGYLHPTPAQFEHAHHLLDQVGLADKHAQLYATLSTGQRLRTLLARALVRKPELLLLDEPTAGLDLPARETLLATLARLHKNPVSPPPAIVTITHHLEELLPNTTNILLLSGQGTIIAQGPPETVLTDGHLSAAYQIPVHITLRHNRYSAHVDPRSWDQLVE